MNIIRLFAVASLFSAAAALSPVANAEPGVEVHAGGVTVGIGDNDRDCRSIDGRRDCRGRERTDPAISIGQADRHGDSNDRDHHEHVPYHDGDESHDAH